MNTDNPYQAPSANVVDVHAGEQGHFAAQPRRVPAGRGVAWINEGFAGLFATPGPWLTVGLIIVLINGVPELLKQVFPPAGLLALLGWPIVVLLQGGIMYALHNYQSPTLAAVMEGARASFGRLLLLSVIIVVWSVVIVIALLATMGTDSGFLSGQIDPDLMAANMASRLWLIVALVVVGLAPLSMVGWFAPGLIAAAGRNVTRALLESVTASLRNWLAMLVFGLVALVLFIAVMLVFALLVGATVGIAAVTGAGTGTGGDTLGVAIGVIIYIALLMVATPVFYGIVFASLRDIFGAGEPGIE